MKKIFLATFLLMTMIVAMGVGCPSDKTTVINDDYSPSAENFSANSISENNIANDQGGFSDCNFTFDHVQPGIRSELYLNISTIAGAEISASASGPGMMNTDKETQITTTDSSGKAKITWNINRFGQYEGTAKATKDGKSVGTCKANTKVK